MRPDRTPSEQEVARIIDAGVLGRSPIYNRLLQYLAKQSASGSLPKEVDIAADVFERKDFDPANDSTVRVYLHNLRQKLDAFYENDNGGDGRRLTIPKGEYRLRFESPATAKIESRPASAGLSLRIALLAAVLVIAAFFAGRMTWVAPPTVADRLGETPVWRALLDDDRVVTVVLGDYYIFAEQDEYGPGNRLIRDFSINDKADLDAFLNANPDEADRYTDIRLSYLPLGIGAALESVLRVLHAAGKSIRVVPQSQFRPQLIRSGHVVYVGYLSGMDHLATYAFSASRLAIGTSYDELIDTESDEVYVSRAGYITDDAENYTDYGFMSTFPGPADNQFLYIAGMRDEGLMRMASTLANPADVAELVARLPAENRGQTAPAFEALYRVSSFDRTYVAATLLLASPISAAAIWEN